MDPSFGLDDVVRWESWGTAQGWVRRLAELGDAPSAARDAFGFWLRRTQLMLGSAQYFLAYVNGKSAVRLSSAAPGIQMMSLSSRLWFSVWNQHLGKLGCTM